MNIERARFNMVEQQIRPWEVLDQRVLDLMEDAPRDAFVPEDFRRLAYADISIPLGEGEVMMPPRVEARMIQALRLDPEDRVLEVGTGSGFATFLLSRCAAYVTTVEVSERLATFGRSNLERHGVRNVNSETGDAGSGWERDAPYDAIAVTGSIQGQFFRLDDHLKRFARSCESLRLDCGLPETQIRSVLADCVRRAQLRDAYVEMLCTRGQPQPGSRDPRLCKNRFYAFAVPFVWVLSPEVQQRGGHLHISDIARISPRSVDPTVKNFHWADLTRGLFQAFEHGADTTVLVDMDGNISEGPGFNVFCVRDGAVTTPGGTVLEGITRQSVRELCEELGIELTVGVVTPGDLRDADEVFLSSTAGGIMPISRVDDRVLCNDAPGPISVRLKALYWDKHAAGWHATPIDYG